MLRTLLVPLDGSVVAEQALPHARRLAQQTGADLLLVRAAPYHHDPARPISPLRVTAREAEAYLQALQFRLADQHLHVRIKVLQTDPVRAITFAALRHAADLIAMSTHGYSGLQRLLLGSVADAVVHRTPKPVFLVRASESPKPPADPYRKVLVPLDGTPFAETALPYLLKMGCNPQEIVLLYAASSGASFPFEKRPEIPAPADVTPLQTSLNREQREALRYLTEVSERYLHGRATRMEVQVASAGQAIAEAAYAEGIEFIVMATHDRTGFDRLIHGSVAGEVLRQAPVPVLLLHGAAVQSAFAAQEAPRQVGELALSAGIVPE